MNSEVSEIIRSLMGKRCCRIKVGNFRSLSIGFGEKIYHNNPRLNDDYYGEWELGTYYCSWRIMRNNRILCGVNDTAENIEELNRKANTIVFGNLISVSQLSDIDVRLTFDSDTVVDFIATISDEDEYFHIFCPNKIYIELSVGGKWTIARSDRPFSRSEKSELTDNPVLTDH